MGKTEAQDRWSKAIRRRLVAWGWSQRELADYLGMPPQRVSDYARGRRAPSEGVRAELIEKLRIAPGEVLPEWATAFAEVPPAPVKTGAA